MDDQNFLGGFNIDPLLPARGSQSNQQRKNIGLKAIDVNDYEEKLRMTDKNDFHQSCILLLDTKDSNNNPQAIKRYFELEKVEILVPNTNETTPVLMLFDRWSRLSVGANLERLDEFKTPQRKNIILSSMSGLERGQKRLIKVTLVAKDNEKVPLEIIISSRGINKPLAQSMKDFQKHQIYGKTTYWTEPIS